jgi:hypothetical protein
MICAVQDIVMDMDALKEGCYGWYPESFLPEVGPRQTFCNQAVFFTISTLDKNFMAFTKGQRGIPETSDRVNYPRGSAYWYDVLVELAQDASSPIEEVTPEKAQELANWGHLVIGAWKGNPIPHFVTVRPGERYTPDDGPQVAHVGGQGNGVKTAQDAFVGHSPIKWFYNKNQQLSRDLSFINQCRWRMYK